MENIHKSSYTKQNNDILNFYTQHDSSLGILFKSHIELKNRLSFRDALQTSIHFLTNKDFTLTIISILRPDKNQIYQGTFSKLADQTFFVFYNGFYRIKIILMNIIFMNAVAIYITLSVCYINYKFQLFSYSGIITIKINSDCIIFQ